MARGFRRDGITRVWFQQRGTAATISICQKKNGLTSQAGSIFGHRRAATPCTCQSKPAHAVACAIPLSQEGQLRLGRMGARKMV